MEKIHLQGYFPYGWFSSRIFQISELLGAAWINGTPNKKNTWLQNVYTQNLWHKEIKNKNKHTNKQSTIQQVNIKKNEDENEWNKTKKN